MSCSNGLCTFPHKDVIKKNCEQDPKFAFKQYVFIYHACFKPATYPGPYGRGSSSYFHKKGIKECYERLKKRDTESVRAAALKGKGHETIEYCLRCATYFCSAFDVQCIETLEYNRLLTGTKAPFDEETAFAMLRKVIQCGKYTPIQRAIAANLACAYYKRRLWDEGRLDSANAFVLADMSCKFGLFTWNVLHLIQTYEREKGNPESTLSTANDLWREYAKYREETGIQRMTKGLCSKCGKPPGKYEQMKQCAGDCMKEKKPVYCSRECQKAVSYSDYYEFKCIISINRIGLNTKNGASSRELRVKWIGQRILNERIGSTARNLNLTGSTARRI